MKKKDWQNLGDRTLYNLINVLDVNGVVGPEMGIFVCLLGARSDLFHNHQDILYVRCRKLTNN